MNPQLNINQLNPLLEQSWEIDPFFEESINDLTKNVIQKEKETFQPGVESFQIYSERIRKRIQQSLIQFQQNFREGYQTLLTPLTAQGITEPRISVVLDKGNLQIFGFSHDLLVHFYRTAYKLAQEKNFKKGRNAFLFLAKIAPQVADFWLGYAICCTQLREYETALDATLCAIRRNPKKIGGYINALYLYIQLQEDDKANILCENGIKYASNHAQEQWSQDLTQDLKKAQRILNKKR